MEAPRHVGDFRRLVLLGLQAGVPRVDCAMPPNPERKARKRLFTRERQLMLAIQETQPRTCAELKSRLDVADAKSRCDRANTFSEAQGLVAHLRRHRTPELDDLPFLIALVVIKKYVKPAGRQVLGY